MKPNIIYFVADQMRSDSLHHMGCEASITPHLDALVNEGVSFSNAYCQNPVCVPSRCSFMSGLYPHTTGHRTMMYLQDPQEPNIMRTMKNNGYEVIWVGRNDLVPATEDKEQYCDIYLNGYDYHNGIHDLRTKGLVTHDKPKNIDPAIPGFYSHYIGKITDKQARAGNHAMGSDWGCIEHTLRYLEERDPSKPFFLYLTISFPHPPYGCEDPWYSAIDRSLIKPRRKSALSLDKPSMEQGICRNQHLGSWLDEHYLDVKGTYLAMVSRFDHHFGMLVDKLKELGYYDQSSIFVFSDHGDYTGDYDIVEKIQNCFENPICNVPLLIKPAKGFEVKPRITPALTELVDLTQTIVEMAGIQTEYINFGKSLLPVLAGLDTNKDAVFCEGGRIHGETWCMESGHGPESPYYPRLKEQCSEGPQHTKATMIRMGNLKYTKRLYEKDELYDLEKDPDELENIIDDPAYKEKLLEMKERMLDWYQKTADTLPIRKDLR